MVYLKEFETVSAYETFAASVDFVEPNVSMIGEYGASGFAVKYNKDKPGPTPPAHDYSQDYLTFVFSTTGSITTNYDTLCFSNDNGETWVQELSNLNPGDRVLAKAYIKKAYSDVCDCPFSCEGNYSVEGNIMSIYDADGFKNMTSFESDEHDLACFFYPCTGLTSAENLVLPATTLTNNCYYGMFNGCTSLTTAPLILPATNLADSCYGTMFYECSSLTTAPELPATTLASSCYSAMFAECTSLNYIKCLATDISAESCTDNWVDNVSSTGTFVKNPNMSSWSTGDSGIPTNWTVQDAS